jgi:hypothetical protein
MKNALDYDRAHKFVDNFAGARWEGWTIKIFTPSTSAWKNKKAVFVDGKMGFELVVDVNAQGRWEIPNRYLKYV